jgi:hypothetical protein
MGRLGRDARARSPRLHIRARCTSPSGNPRWQYGRPAYVREVITAVTAFWYAKAFVGAFTQPSGKELDWDSHAIKVMLTTASYVPNQDSHQYKSSISNEVSGTGYTAGGATLASKTATNTNNVFALDAADCSWPSSTLVARRAVIYDDNGATDADKPLLCWIDFGQDESTTNGTFLLAFAAAGIATITAADASGFP